MQLHMENFPECNFFVDTWQQEVANEGLINFAVFFSKMT
jgi:hypothetical protein